MTFFSSEPERNWSGAERKKSFAPERSEKKFAPKTLVITRDRIGGDFGPGTGIMKILGGGACPYRKFFLIWAK